MKNYIYIITLTCTLLLTLSSCGDEKFTIDAKVDNMGTQNIRLLYLTDDNINYTWLPAINGEFSFQGVSSEYTIVNIITQTAENITQAIVRNGERVEVTGDFRDKSTIQVSGNKINDSYFSFINKHKELFKSKDRAQIDAEIINFIGSNRSNMASTMLLYSKFSDINNQQLIDSLLNLIDTNAKPDNITEYYLNDMHRVVVSDSIKDTIATNLDKFIMLAPKEKVYEFDATNGGKGYSVIYFWGDDTVGQSRRINTLVSMLNWHKGKDLQMTDISLIQDNMKWERVINRDTVPWTNLQAIGGEYNRVLKRVGITQTPMYLVTDSVGDIIYRGSELNGVSSTLDKYLK
ncbi:MAG: hypothetical protein R3Y22_06930 [Bacteroidales bacterium]